MKFYKENNGWKQGNEAVYSTKRVNGTGKRHGIANRDVAIHTKIEVGTPPNSNYITAEDIGEDRVIFFFHRGYDEGGNSIFEPHILAKKEAITDKEKKRNQNHSGWLY